MFFLCYVLHSDHHRDLHRKSKQFSTCAFVVTCHSGVTLAAAHALKLAPQLLEKTFNTSFEAFSAGRFNVQTIT